MAAVGDVVGVCFLAVGGEPWNSLDVAQVHWACGGGGRGCSGGQGEEREKEEREDKGNGIHVCILCFCVINMYICTLWVGI